MQTAIRLFIAVGASIPAIWEFTGTDVLCRTVATCIVVGAGTLTLSWINSLLVVRDDSDRQISRPPAAIVEDMTSADPRAARSDRISSMRTLEAGKQADLVVLDRDYIDCAGWRDRAHHPGDGVGRRTGGVRGRGNERG